MTTQNRSKYLCFLGTVLAALLLQGCAAQFKLDVPSKVGIGEPVIVKASVASVLAKEASGWTVSPATEAVEGEDSAVFKKILDADLKARIDKIEASYGEQIKQKEADARESAIAKKRLADLEVQAVESLDRATQAWVVATSDTAQAAWRTQLADAKAKADATVKNMDTESSKIYLILAGSTMFGRDMARQVDDLRKNGDWGGIYRFMTWNPDILGSRAARASFDAVFKAWMDYLNLQAQEPKKIPRPTLVYTDEYRTLKAKVAKLDAPPSADDLVVKRDKEIQDQKDQRFDKDFGLRKFFAFKPADAGKTFAFVWDKTNCSDCKNTDGKIEVTGPSVGLGKGVGTISATSFSVDVTAALTGLTWLQSDPKVTIVLVDKPSDAQGDSPSAKQAPKILYQGPAKLNGNSMAVKLVDQKHDLGSIAGQADVVDASAVFELNGVEIGSVDVKLTRASKWQLKDAKVSGTIDMKTKQLDYEIRGTFPNQDRWNGDEVIDYELRAFIGQKKIILGQGTLDSAGKGVFGSGPVKKDLNAVEGLQGLESAGQRLPVEVTFLNEKKAVATTGGALSIPGNAKVVDLCSGVAIDGAVRVEAIDGNLCTGTEGQLHLWLGGATVIGYNEFEVIVDVYTDDPATPELGPTVFNQSTTMSIPVYNDSFVGLRHELAVRKKNPKGRVTKVKVVVRCEAGVLATATTAAVKTPPCPVSGRGAGSVASVSGPKLRLIKAEGDYAVSQAGLNAVLTQVVSTQTPVGGSAAPTNTAVPTATLVPTAVPTATALPTSTPVPTAVPTPDPCADPCALGCPFAICNPTCPQYIGAGC